MSVNRKCKFLTCDSYFHYNTCMLKQKFKELLDEYFEAHGYKYPYLAELMDDACVCEDCDKCVEVENKVYVTQKQWEEREKEITDLVNEDMTVNYNEQLYKNLYESLKKKHILALCKEIVKTQKTIQELCEEE